MYYMPNDVLASIVPVPLLNKHKLND